VGAEMDLREGMAVFDPAGHRVGRVESLHDGHFFVTHTPRLPLVVERIAVDAADSVESVDAAGVHLRHDRHQLLMLDERPRESLSSRQVAPGEDPTALQRGDEDRGPLETDDRGESSPAGRAR
jgi:hypothetical protein